MQLKWLVIAGLLLVGLGVFVWMQRQSAETIQVQAVVVPSGATGLTEVLKTPTEAGSQAATPETSSGIDYEKAINSSEDLYEFAQQALVDARRGNGAAQYYLSLVLSECKFFDQAYFVEATGPAGDRRRTLDEAQQYAVQRGGLSLEYVTRVLKRCERLMETHDESFGTSDEWLRAATESGFPRAQVQTAAEKAMKARNITDPDESQALLGESRRLMFDALRSKDPGAIAVVGDVASWLDGNNDAQRHEWVWLLAACQRGLDCSRESAHYRFRCGFDPQCQPYENGMVDVVRRITGEGFADLERRATEINEKIDQDRFDELGL